MSRRRKGNPLLARILLISAAIHVVALPILAHFGTFRAIQKRYFDTQMVVLAPPKAAHEDVKAPPKAVTKTGAHASKTPGGPKRGKAQPHLSNLPPVVSSAGGADSGEPTVDSSSTGRAGVVPTGPKQAGPGDSTPPEQPNPGQAMPPEKPAEIPKPAPSAPAAPQPAAPAPTPRHVPVYADAQPVYAPEPVIPDDLRYDAVDKTTVLEFLVGADGNPTQIRVATTSGIDALDKVAVESVKRWRFHAATRDGDPIARTIRLKVEFKVD